MTEAEVARNQDPPLFRHERLPRTQSGLIVNTSIDQHCSNCGVQWIAVIRQEFGPQSRPGETALTSNAADLYKGRVFFCPDCRRFADSTRAIHFPKGFLKKLDDLIRQRSGERFGLAVASACASLFLFFLGLLGLSGRVGFLAFVAMVAAIGLFLFALWLSFQSVLAKLRSPKLRAAVTRLSEKDAEDLFSLATVTAWKQRLSSPVSNTPSLFGSENAKASPEDCWCYAHTLWDEVWNEVAAL